MKYNFAWLTRHVSQNRKSWLVVAVINIPLSISLAIASGATPIQWIITAMWAGMIAAVFASSNFNIFGPAGALSGILLGAAISYGAVYFPLIAVLSWLLMLLVYFLGISKYITLIPSAGLQWFLFAVWVTILVAQLPGWFWLDVEIQEKVYLTLIEIVAHFPSLGLFTTSLFLWGFLFLWLARRHLPKVPWILMLFPLWILIGYLSKNGFIHEMTLLWDKYPDLAFSFYHRDWLVTTYANLLSDFQMMTNLFAISVVIMAITIIETVISAKIAQKSTKQPFNKNREVLWNALANIGSGLMGWLPATGVLVRTSLNINSGATSKMSWFIAAFWTLIISWLLFNNVFVFFPIPLISAILVFIAINIMDFHMLKKMYAFKKTSFYIIIVTIVVSIVRDTIIWIMIWTLLSLLIYLKQFTKGDINVTIFRKKEFLKKTLLSQYIHEQHPDDIVIVKFLGELNYLNIEGHFDHIEQLSVCKKVVLSFSQMSDIDIDGVETLEEEMQTLEKKWIETYVVGLCNAGISQLYEIPSIKKHQDANKVADSASLLLNRLFDKY